MIVTYKPIPSNRRAIFTQPSPDVMRVEWLGRTYELEMTDPGVEYEIPDEVRDVIHRAYRETEGGPLQVYVPGLGPIHQEITIDHGTDTELGWE